MFFPKQPEFKEPDFSGIPSVTSEIKDILNERDIDRDRVERKRYRYIMAAAIISAVAAIAAVGISIYQTQLIIKDQEKPKYDIKSDPGQPQKDSLN